MTRTTIALAGGFSIVSSAFGQLFTKTENFSSDPSWIGVNNLTPPQNFGWSNTNHCGVGTGEIGGTITRDTAPFAHYGVDIGTVDQSQVFGFSGTVAFVNPRGSYFFGYFNEPVTFNGLGDPADFLGFAYDGHETTTDVYVQYDNENASRNNVLIPAVAAGGATHTFSVSYDPATERVTYKLNDMEPMTMLVGTTATFNRFGMFPAFSDGNPCIDFYDNLTYNTTIAPPAQTQWNVDGDGNWSVSGNWSAGVPNAVDATANFGTIITAARTVTVDAPHKVGTINFDNANNYTIAGSSTLTLDSNSPAGITVMSGSHTISAPLVLNDDTTVTVTPTGSILTFSGELTATGKTITKAGPGAAQFENIRATGVNINVGTVRISSKGSPNDSAGTSVVQSLSIDGGVTPTATLDLTDNSLVVDYTGASPLATIQAQITSGYASGAWAGPGITSSTAAVVAASASNNKTALGFAEAGFLGLSTFAGQTVDADAMVIRYTLTGDANVDGTVNSFDFNALATNFGSSGKSWQNGDFNYDATVNSQDFNAIATNFGLTLASSGSPASIVPEPTGIAILASLLPWRRRRPFASQFRAQKPRP